MADPYEKAQRAIEDVSLRGPGQADSTLRQALFNREPGKIPSELAELVEKIEQGAYRVTDEDVAKLKATYSEDQLFELVVCTILGASKRRLDAGLRALEEA
jgi:hypothetical protein